jgi:hypothetical protein
MPAPVRTTGPDRLARCLIIGCGCRGRALARALCGRSHAVRGTTRSPARAQEIRAAGAEPFIADPGRIATLMPALDRVAVVCVLRGSASEPTPDGPRLEMLLARLIETTVHGILYEGRGAELVRRACERSRIAYVLLDVAPDDHEAWLAAAVAGIERLLS